MTGGQSMSEKLLIKQSLHRLPWNSVVSLPHSGQKSVRVRVRAGCEWVTIGSCLCADQVSSIGGGIVATYSIYWCVSGALDFPRFRSMPA